MTALLTASTGLACVFAFISLAWVVQWRSGNAGIVDAFWSWSLGFLGVLYALLGPAPEPQRLLPTLTLISNGTEVAPFFNGMTENQFDAIVALAACGGAARGGTPYRDAIDIKPPGVYLLYALAIQTLGL